MPSAVPQYGISSAHHSRADSAVVCRDVEMRAMDHASCRTIRRTVIIPTAVQQCAQKIHIVVQLDGMDSVSKSQSLGAQRVAAMLSLVPASSATELADAQMRGAALQFAARIHFVAIPAGIHHAGRLPNLILPTADRRWSAETKMLAIVASCIWILPSAVNKIAAMRCVHSIQKTSAAISHGIHTVLS